MPVEKHVAATEDCRCVIKHAWLLRRYVPMFGEVDYDPRRAYTSVGLAEQLNALGAAVAAGKVRRVGLSNETPWGLTTACHLGAPLTC